MVVVVIIPIVVVVPAALIFIPPAMAVGPAVFAGLVQLVAPVLGLMTLPAVVLHGLMKLMIRLADAFLAIVRPRARCPGEKKGRCERDRQQRNANEFHSCLLLCG